MHTDPEVIDRIKAAIAKTIADALGDEGLPLAATCLERIDQAVADPADPRRFVPGRRVKITASGERGTVERTVEHQGETHTVVVRLDVSPAAVPFSPRELEVVTER